MPRPLGSLLVDTVSGRAPMVVAVVYLVSEPTPVTALVQEAPSEDFIGQVMVHGFTIDTENIMSDFSYSEQRPTDGGGIRRRSVSFNLQNYGEEETGGPFVSKVAPTQEDNKFDWLWRRLYTGGISRDELYIEVYLVDRSAQMAADITLGTTLGTYRIDFSTAWQEKDGSTKLSLIDAMLVEDNLVGATDDTIDDRIYIFNSWFKDNCIPQAYGMVPRVRTLNSFPSVDTRDLSSTFNGTIRAAFTGASSSILLAEDVEFGNPLLELAILGAEVRIKVGSGECIAGTLQYNAGPQTISLVSLTRNVPYAIVKAYTYNTEGGIPENWGLGQLPPATWSLRQMVIVNARTIVQAATGWGRSNINFYNAATVPQPVDTFLKKWQFEGFGDFEGAVRHAPISHPGRSDSSVSLSWNTAQNNNSDGYAYTFSGSGTLVHFIGVYRDVELFFVDPDVGSTSGSVGDPWSLVAIDQLDVEYDTYIKNGNSRFEDTHVYAEGDGTLIKIPPANVVSITTGVTAYGSADLVRIRLDAPPLEMGIGATSNVVYTDAMYNSSANQNRPETILNNIIADHSLLLKDFIGDSLYPAGYATNPWMPWVGYIARGREKLSELIDRFCYQTAATLIWVQGFVEIEQHVQPASFIHEDTGGFRKLKNVPLIRPEDMLLDDSAAFQIGVLETLTQKDTDFFNNTEHFEYRAMFYELGFGAWEDPFAPTNQSKANNTIPKGYYKYDYHFDLINDSSSAYFAASQTLTAGHPSGFATVDRKLKANFDLYALRINAMDKVRWGSFPFFTDPIPTPDDRPGLDGLGNWTYPIPEGPIQYVLNGFVVIDSLNLSMDVDDFNLEIEGSMSQPWTEAKMSWITGPLTLVPNAPPDPSTSVNDNPGQGSGTSSSYGSLTPKTWVL